MTICNKINLLRFFDVPSYNLGIFDNWNEFTPTTNSILKDTVFIKVDFLVGSKGRASLGIAVIFSVKGR